MILERDPEARDSNERLYEKYLLSQPLHYFGDTSVTEFFRNFKKYGISSFESVTRARRKIVEKHPELGASPEVQEKRHEQQCDMWDYAKGRDF